MVILLCLLGAVVFWWVIMPAARSSEKQSEAERNAEALDRLTKP